MNDKDIWKWILDTMPQGELLELAKKHRIKVAGFRQITWQSQYKVLKPRLVTGLLNPIKLNEIRDDIRKHQENCDDCYMLLSKNKEELKRELKSIDKARNILKVLLSAVEEDKHQLAYDLFEEEVNKIKIEKDIAGKDKENGVNNESPKNNEKDFKKDIKVLENQLKKKESRIQELQRQTSKAENELKKEKERWNKEKKLLNEQLNQLKNEIQDKEQTIEKFKEEEDVLKNRLDSLNQKLDEKQDEINHFHAIQLISPTIDHIEVATTVEKPQKNIALIGNARSLENVNCYSHHPTIIEPTKIDEITDNDDWDIYDEIHIISFELTSGRIRKLKRLVHKEKIREFNTIHQLISYVDKQGV